MDTPAQPATDAWSRLGRGLRWLLGFVLRLLVVIVLAVGLALAVYVLVPRAYAALVEPVQAHTAQIARLDGALSGLRTSVDDGQAALDQRLTALETGGDAARDRVAGLEAQAAEQATALAAEQTARQALETQGAQLLAHANAQATQAAGLAALAGRLVPAATQSAAELETLRWGASLAQLRSQLLEARVQIVGENLGEARRLLAETAAQVRALLTGPGPLSADARAALANRLVTAEALIADRPVEALGEFQALWALMARGDAAPAAATGTPAATGTARP